MFDQHKKSNEKWLLDAEVQYTIIEEQGRWVVSLVFIDTNDPNHILIQKINDYRSKRLAEIAAQHMQQNAAMDRRGTQKVNKDADSINRN